MTPKQLTRKREGLNLSRCELAEIIGVSHSTVSRWESGRVKIGRAFALLIDTELSKQTRRAEMKRRGRPKAKKS